MSFEVDILSEFAGVCRWTQLINQYRYRDEVAGFWTKNTGGDFWADGGEFYAAEILHAVLLPGATNTLGFADGPGNPVGLWVVTAVDSFETYLRFRPEGEESIWVTLGRVDWSWDVSADNPLGWPYNNIPENWTITRSIIPDPVLGPDISFPFWLDVTWSIGE